MMKKLIFAVLCMALISPCVSCQNTGKKSGLKVEGDDSTQETISTTDSLSIRNLCAQDIGIQTVDLILQDFPILIREVGRKLNGHTLTNGRQDEGLYRRGKDGRDILKYGVIHIPAPFRSIYLIFYTIF